MIPSRRLLALLLAGLVPVIIGAATPSLRWTIWVYVLLLIGFVALDWFMTPKPKLLEVARINEPKLSIGEQNLITLAVHNQSPRTLDIQIRDEFPVEFPSDTLILKTKVEPESVQEISYHVRPLRRGDYRFGNINLRYTSTFGTFLRQTKIAFDELVKVYPNVLDVRKYDMLARKGMLFELGLRTARVFGSGTEFERLREYTPDDEFRSINWKASARRNKLIAAEYETERSQYVVAVIDTGRLMRPTINDIAKLDYAINASLMLGYVAMLKGDHIGMLSFADHVGRFLQPRRGKAQFYQMLEMLYNLPSQPVEADYGRAISYLGLKNKRRSLIVIFTDLSTMDTAKPLIQHMARLAKTHLALCVVMSDPNLVGYAGKAAYSSTDVYERAVAEMVLDERRVVLDTLNQAGVHTIDVPANKLTVSVINKYLEFKGRGLI
ncbi:DUF58 domain-containing protein [Herpetosiphon gulosus]|uniref:DUF58 domain-containing protein n=1 Tax=Herpetosiphon gulosus TaxID=1973496 RepID=A0ABP9X2X2_9CHLR